MRNSKLKPALWVIFCLLIISSACNEQSATEGVSDTPPAVTVPSKGINSVKIGPTSHIKNLYIHVVRNGESIEADAVHGFTPSVTVSSDGVASVTAKDTFGLTVFVPQGITISTDLNGTYIDVVHTENACLKASILKTTNASVRVNCAYDKITVITSNGSIDVNLRDHPREVVVRTSKKDIYITGQYSRHNVSADADGGKVHYF